MRVLFTVAFLDGYHGSVIHVFEWANFFVKQGYQVHVSTIFYTDEIKEMFTQSAIQVSLVDEMDIDDTYDLVFAYHFPTIGLLLNRGLACKKLVLGSLSSYEPLESFPLNWEKASLLTVMSEETRQVHASQYGIPLNRMSIIENCVPDEYWEYQGFSAKSNTQLKKIAVISNHAPEELRKLKNYFNSQVVVDLIGMGGDRIVQVTPEFLTQYDVIISIGKTVQYALSLEIPVYEYDHFGGNGYITLENFDTEKKHNFSGRPVKRKLTTEAIAKEIIEGYFSVLSETKQLRTLCEENFSLSSRLTALLQHLKLTKDFEQEPPDSLALAHHLAFVRWSRALKKHISYLEPRHKRLKTRQKLANFVHRRCSKFWHSIKRNIFRY